MSGPNAKLLNPLKAGTKDYLNQNVVPTLITALTKLSIARPEDPMLWLSHYMLEESPMKDIFAIQRIDPSKSSSRPTYYELYESSNKNYAVEITNETKINDGGDESIPSAVNSESKITENESKEDSASVTETKEAETEGDETKNATEDETKTAETGGEPLECDTPLHLGLRFNGSTFTVVCTPNNNRGFNLSVDKEATQERRSFTVDDDVLGGQANRVLFNGAALAGIKKDVYNSKFQQIRTNIITFLEKNY